MSLSFISIHLASSFPPVNPSYSMLHITSSHFLIHKRILTTPFFLSPSVHSKLLPTSSFIIFSSCSLSSFPSSSTSYCFLFSSSDLSLYYLSRISSFLYPYFLVFSFPLLSLFPNLPSPSLPVLSFSY